jgi:teichuronic acid biosynthesis glycosyltransferase TuaG
LNRAWCVSIIMAAYDAASFIGDAVRSVLRQAHQDFELIVVDDGSEDETVRVAESFGDPRIRILRRPHRGVSAARNAGLEIMRGDTFLFLDADDELTEGSLRSRLPILERDDRVEFVDGRVIFMDAALRRERGDHRPSFRGHPLKKLVSLSPGCFAGSNWLIRRVPHKVYRLAEGMTHCEDLLFYISVAAQGSGAYDYTQDVVARVRRGHHSAMTNLTGLERGYWRLYQEVERLPGTDARQLETLRRRIRAIMWRSYARNGQWRAALRSIVLPRRS